MAVEKQCGYEECSKLDLVVGLPQLFIRREKGVLVLVVAKYADGILIAAFNE